MIHVHLVKNSACVLAILRKTLLFLTCAVGLPFCLYAQALPPSVNLAPVAIPSASYVSGDTAVTALNSGYLPRNSRDNHRGSLGNWPHKGTEWVEYDWSQPISTKQIEV